MLMPRLEMSINCASDLPDNATVDASVVHTDSTAVSASQLVLVSMVVIELLCQLLDGGEDRTLSRVCRL